MPPTEKSVLIVIHGMGEQRQNQTLTGVMPQFVGLMKTRGMDPRWKPEFAGNLSFATQSDVQITNGTSAWRFAEYWWAQSFLPASSWKIARWIAFHLIFHLVSMLRSLAQARKDLPPPFGSTGEQHDPLASRLHNAFSLPLYLALVGLLLVLTPLLSLALVSLGYISRLPGVPSLIHYFKSLLDMIGIAYLGDIYTYLDDPVQAALIRGGLESMITEAVSDNDVKRVVLFAHSTGNMLAYDALAHLHEVGTPGLAKVTAFVSAGSILPMVWNKHIVRKDDDRFTKPLPKDLHWYHLWTRFDIGPAGPLTNLPANLVAQGPTAWSRRVSNADDLFLDHTGYWSNIEQVHALLLEEMGGMDSANDFWRGPGTQRGGDWTSRSAQTWDDFNLRRKAIAILAVARLVPTCTLVFGFPLFLWFNGWAKGIAAFLRLDWIANLFGISWLANAVTTPQLSVWSTILLAAVASAVMFGLAFVVLFTAFKKLWWDRWYAKGMHDRDDAFKNWRTAARAGTAP